MKYSYFSILRLLRKSDKNNHGDIIFVFDFSIGNLLPH